MTHEVRAAVLAVKADRLLLVQHEFPGGTPLWVPPGGKIEGGESIYDCAAAEFKQETGVDAKLGRIAYVAQFLLNDRNSLTFYILADELSGTPKTQGAYGKENEWVRDLRYVNEEEVKRLEVYPKFLKDRFWKDFGSGFRRTINLGATKV